MIWLPPASDMAASIAAIRIQCAAFVDTDSSNALLNVRRHPHQHQSQPMLQLSIRLEHQPMSQQTIRPHYLLLLQLIFARRSKRRRAAAQLATQMCPPKMSQCSCFSLANVMDANSTELTIRIAVFAAMLSNAALPNVPRLLRQQGSQRKIPRKIQRLIQPQIQLGLQPMIQRRIRHHSQHRLQRTSARCGKRRPAAAQAVIFTR